MPPFLIHFLSLCPQPQEEILVQPVLRVFCLSWQDGMRELAYMVDGVLQGLVAGATLVVFNIFIFVS